MSDPTSRRESNRALTTTVGFYMWRGGLVFCGVYLAYEGWVRAFRFIREIGVPLQMAAGLSFVVLGFVLLFASLIVERVIDARAERGLKDL